MSADQLGYDGKVVIITGAGGGLGRQHALLMASRGALVVINDLGGAVDGSGSDKGAADRVVDEIKSLGGDAVADTNTVATPEGGAAIVQTAVDAYGKVDVVINNAGILRDKAFHNLEPDQLNAVLDVHLKGRPGASCANRVMAASSARPAQRVCSATSARPTTARRKWAWSASLACSPSRVPSSISRPTRSLRWR
jgi:NAD(P)-dependent dehydrogenase (short-subunit alcohol dehydrogenase family)